MCKLIWNIRFKLLYLLPCKPFNVIQKLPSASVNPTSQLWKFLSNLINLFLDSRVRDILLL
jgi:hypothetical protein